MIWKESSILSALTGVVPVPEQEETRTERNVNYVMATVLLKWKKMCMFM